jgi:hypothetical protein
MALLGAVLNAKHRNKIDQPIDLKRILNFQGRDIQSPILNMKDTVGAHLHHGGPFQLPCLSDDNEEEEEGEKQEQEEEKSNDDDYCQTIPKSSATMTTKTRTTMAGYHLDQALRIANAAA